MIKKQESDKNSKTIEKNKQDEILKHEIFDIIYQGVFSDESILVIINRLNANNNYDSYANYFAGWIEDIISRKNEISAKIVKERKNGKSDEEIIKQLSAIEKYKNLKKYFKVLISAEIVEDVEEKSEIEH